MRDGNVGMLHNLADLIKIKKDKMTILVLGLNNSILNNLSVSYNITIFTRTVHIGSVCHL